MISRLLAFSLLAAAWLCASGTARAEHRRPNILFLFSDDQRPDTIRALGNSGIRTPNLDALVGQGTTFTHTYCMGAQQGAVCVPSRAMLMTGRTLFRIKDNLAGQATWPETFAQAGYATFITGKWHNGAESVKRAFQQGKAIFLGGMGNPYQLSVQDLSPEHTLVNKRVSGEHSVQQFADAAVEFLRRQKGETPFLCYVAFNAPHDPRVAPKEFHERYQQALPALPGNFLPQHPFNNGALVIRDEELAPWPRTPEVVRQHLADYYASIEHLDAQIGRILAALKQSGQAEKTIVVFSSDHGLALGSHGLLGKQNLYEHSMGAPLILAGPGIPAGQRSDALCYLLDIFPTLGELAGIEPVAGSEGQSLQAVLTGRARVHREVIFTAYTKVQRAVRDDRWKLIVYPRINRVQLFDLQADPLEKNDLAEDARYSAEKQRLWKLLEAEQQRADDHLALTSEHPEPPQFDFSQVKPKAKPAAGE